MAFNLQQSRKPEYKLNEKLINESIQIYGVPTKYLYSSKNNKDLVFKDFSHFSLSDTDFKEVYILPENTENWDGDFSFNNFGLYSNLTQRFYISKKSVIELYPELEGTDSITDVAKFRSKFINTLMILPSETILEITDMASLSEGVNNLWAFGDGPSVYVLSTKVYDNNIADQNIRDINTTITIEETGTPKTEDNTIFEHDEIVDTNSLDSFLDSIAQDTEIKDAISETGDDKGLKPNSNDTVFGTLG